MLGSSRLGVDAIDGLNPVGNCGCCWGGTDVIETPSSEADVAAGGNACDALANRLSGACVARCCRGRAVGEILMLSGLTVLTGSPSIGTLASMSISIGETNERAERASTGLAENGLSSPPLIAETGAEIVAISGPAVGKKPMLAVSRLPAWATASCDISRPGYEMTSSIKP